MEFLSLEAVVGCDQTTNPATAVGVLQAERYIRSKLKLSSYELAFFTYNTKDLNTVHN